MAQNAPSIITGFGVEIELTLAFHEDQLVNVLRQRHLTRDHIVKEIPTRVKKAIGLRNHAEHRLYLDTRPGHRGWVLRVDEADSSRDWQGVERANVIGNYRTYWTEPLHIVQNILRSSKNYSIDVQVSTTNDARGALSYHEWKVCNDFTLVPAGKAELKIALEDRITKKELLNWDNTGVELTTPIMHRLGNDIEFEEIRLYLEALHGDETSKFGIFPSKYGAVHVHVGFGDTADTLLVLQHLAFIMLQYEKLIIKLFPRHRNGSHPENILRGLCREDTKSNQQRARLYMISMGDSYKPNMEDLAKDVFSTRSITDLCVVMQFDRPASPPTYGTKGHLVNFINLAEAEKGKDGAKRTVEFRHHESTVDPNAIKMWVKLVLRICRTAERNAKTEHEAQDPGKSSKIVSPAEKERRKYKARPSDLEHVHTMDDLFELIGLEENESLDARDKELREYWQSRYNQYHDANEGLQPSPDFPDSPTVAGVTEQATGSGGNAPPQLQATGSDVGSPAQRAAFQREVSDTPAFTEYRERKSPPSDENGGSSNGSDVVTGSGPGSRAHHRRRGNSSRLLRRLHHGSLVQRKAESARKMNHKKTPGTAAPMSRELRSSKKY